MLNHSNHSTDNTASKAQLRVSLVSLTAANLTATRHEPAPTLTRVWRRYT